MSADNFVLVFPHPNGGWAVLPNQSMSWYCDDPEGLVRYAQGRVLQEGKAFGVEYDDAVEAAFTLDDEEWHEYGVSVWPEDEEVPA